MQNKKRLLLISFAVFIFLAFACYFIFLLISTNGDLKINDELKIGVTTDWEYGYRKNVGNKLTNQAPVELEKVVNYFNNVFHPDIVVSGGDMIESSGIGKEKAKKQLKEINDIFSKLNAKRAYAVGNHDLRVMSKSEIRSELGLLNNHDYFDLGDWRLVIMDTNFNKSDGSDLGPNFYAEGYVSKDEFNWLEESLNTDRPTIIFSHHPVLPINTKNIYNGEEVRVFLEKFPNVILVVSGHDPSLHFNELNGISYLVVDNLANIDSVGSYATINAKYKKFRKNAVIEIEHFGPSSKKFVINKKL